MIGERAMNMKYLTAALLGAVVAVVSLSNINGQPLPQATPVTHGLTLYIGQLTAFRSPKPFKSITLKGDNVNVEASSDRDVVIMAKTAGSEQILFTGEGGSVVANLLVNVTGLERHSMHIHSKIGNLHSYYAYNCPPNLGCYRVKDALEGEDRFPPPTVTVLPFPIPIPVLPRSK
jgi:hypothetical protein